ncbi:hypothetical protein [Sporisorium scitamineum]|nr:hypothetical protein [Sporisorium scitamineum]
MGSSLFHPSRTLLGGGNSSGALGNAELRLLVSRNGLILRTTSPSALSSSLLQGDSPRRCGEARAIFALFGEGASVPAFGQSLVEVPKLAPLLHVVTQAAVVGLAQTVQLTSGGRQITATVQPVLRTRSIDAEGSRRVHAAAAKVWITLSAPSTVMRRSSAIMTPTRTGLGGNTSGGMGTTQLFTPQSRAAALDRRHSYQVFKPESSFQAPRWPLSFHEQAEGGASAASLYAHAVSARTASTSRSHSSAMGKGRESSTQHMPAPLSQESQKTRSEEIFPVNDSLSMLMAQLEEDNRNLRRQIDARRSRRQIQAPVFAQPFAQPFTQPQWSPAPTQSLQGAQMSYPPSYSPLSEEAMPGSCPTRLMYLP